MKSMEGPRMGKKGASKNVGPKQKPKIQRLIEMVCTSLDGAKNELVVFGEAMGQDPLCKT